MVICALQVPMWRDGREGKVVRGLLTSQATEAWRIHPELGQVCADSTTALITTFCVLLAPAHLGSSCPFRCDVV